MNVLDIKARMLNDVVSRIAEAKRAGERTKPVVSVGPSGEEHSTSAFIQRCVAAMTKEGTVDPEVPGQLSRAFAICTAAQKKHPESAREKAKEGVPEVRVKEFESALRSGREATREAQRTEESIILSGSKKIPKKKYLEDASIDELLLLARSKLEGREGLGTALQRVTEALKALKVAKSTFKTRSEAPK